MKEFIQKLPVKKVVKYISYTITTLIITLLLLVISAVIYTYYNGDQIKNYIVKELNKNIATEITIKKIDFSLLKKFPYASLYFTDIVAKDAITGSHKDTLLSAHNVYLQFNIYDIINKKYRIKKIEVKQGKIKIKNYKDGSDNFHFWKPSPNTDASFSLKLEKVDLTDVIINYNNYSANQDYLLDAKDVALKGRFSDATYTLNAEGDVFVNYIKLSGINYFSDKDTRMSAALHVDNEGGLYDITKGKLDVNDLVYNLTGKIIYKEDKKFLDIKVNGEDLDIASFINQLPEEYSNKFKDYLPKGDFDLNMHIEGDFDGNNIPHITSVFSISDAGVSNKTSSFACKNITFKGSYTNGPEHNLVSSSLKIYDFSGCVKEGNINGNFSLNNFSNPEIELTTNSELNLKELNKLFKSDTFATMNGTIKIDGNFKGKLENLNKFTPKDFLNNKTSGTLVIKDVDFTLKKNNLQYNNINGKLSFNNNDIIINELTGSISKSNFSISGSFVNILPFIFLPNQNLNVTGKLKAKYIDLNEILHDNTSASDSALKLVFPDNINCNLTFVVEKLKFNKFIGTNLLGNLRLTDKKLYLNPINIKALGGTISGKAIFDGTNSTQIRLVCFANVDKVDIREMFYECENFYQNNITYENLKGRITTSIYVSGIWNNKLKVDLNSIKANADIEIIKGELVNYKPLESLSSFIKRKDVTNIKFETLKNTISIKDQIIYFPSMDIKSDAINITAYGKHSFNNDLEYHLKILLSEIMSKKDKKNKSDNEQFGPVEDDGLGRTTLFLLATGSHGDIKFVYDKKEVKEKIKSDYQKEKNTVKQILKEEFNLFKNDSSASITPLKEDKHKFKVQWDEAEEDSVKKK